LLVEYFSDQQLIGWRARAKDLQAYHYLWFYELERQRATGQAALIEALQAVPGISVPLEGWGRAISYKYSHVPLSCKGSLRWVGGRFNYGVDIDSARFAPFSALYLAEDFETALREKNGLQRENTRAGFSAEELSLCTKEGFSWVAVQGSVNNVFDLTKATNLNGFFEIIGTFRLSRNVRSLEERLKVIQIRLVDSPEQLHQTFMLEGWREYPNMWSTPANSQIFGHMVRDAGFEGILYASTITGQENLALFPRQFQNSTSIVAATAPPDGAKCCVLDAVNCAEIEAGLI
jgi:hypothetical protein